MTDEMHTGPLQIGDVLVDRYRVTSVLGRGGMGAVYLADQKGLSRKVVIKAVSSRALDDSGVRARFRREARLLKRLTHPNVVDVLDMGETEEGVAFLVLEYLEGTDLRRYLRENGRLSSREVVSIGGQLLSALAQAHSEQIVHRDIKPSNIIHVEQVGAPSLIKLIDFGISRPLAPDPSISQVTGTGQVLGTPEYMAPEHLRGEAVDLRSDLYSAAMVLCELATGYRPRSGGLTHEIMTRRLSGAPISLPAWLMQRPLGKVIDKATQSDPDDRYQSAAQMYDALTGSSLEGVSLDDVPLGHVGVPTKARILWIGLAALLGCLLLFALICLRG